MLRHGGGRLQWTSAEELCSRCTVVLTSLPSVAAITSVAETVIFGRLRGTWIDLSTTDDAEVRRLAPQLRVVGLHDDDAAQLALDRAALLRSWRSTLPLFVGVWGAVLWCGVLWCGVMCCGVM